MKESEKGFFSIIATDSFNLMQSIVKLATDFFSKLWIEIKSVIVVVFIFVTDYSRQIAKDIVSEVVIPLGVAIAVYIGFEEIPYLRDFNATKITQLLVAIGVHLLTYIIIAGFRYNNEFKSKTYQRFGYQKMNATGAIIDTEEDKKLIDIFGRSSYVLFTSIIPNALSDFEAWFEADILSSHIAQGPRALNGKCQQACRVFVFYSNNQLKRLKHGKRMESKYADRVTYIHRDTGFDVAFMYSQKFEELVVSSGLNQITNKLEFDFAFFIYDSQEMILAVAKERKKRSILNPINRIYYDKLSNPNVTQQYITLARKLKKEIYDDNDKLKKCYTYEYHSGRKIRATS